MTKCMVAICGSVAALVLAGCAGSSPKAGGGTGAITTADGRSIQYSGGGAGASGMGDYTDPEAAVAALRPKVAQLMKAGDAQADAEARVVAMSQLANALYFRYQQARDLAFLKESVDMGHETLAECARLDGLISGISMPLIMAKSTQETMLKDREAELARGGAF